METFTQRTLLNAPAAAVFAWHAHPGAFERLSPPWERVQLLSRTGGIENGARTEFYVPVGPFRRRWVAEHRNYIAGRQFQDVQVTGPFAAWTHTHTITPDGPDRCWLEDRIEYQLPFGPLGRLLAGSMARSTLERTFAYRHRVTSDDLRAQLRRQGTSTMRILISGPNGMIGSSLRSFLTTGGHQVVGLSRSKSKPDEIAWDPDAGMLNADDLNGFDGVVHLAGESIAAGRWTEKQKAKILDSRVRGTRLLCEKLASLTSPPKVLVSASAVGYYGDRGAMALDEQSPAGGGFLPEVCKQWEAATEAARQKGIRVVNPRFGVVLSAVGGALKKMLLPFKLGLGGVIGNGSQYWSWIALDDVVGAIHHALTHDELQGPLNATAPNPATNREFTKTLGAVLRRPTIFPLPAPVARLALGEMADALLLASARVLPTKLQSSGYVIRYPTLEGALRHVLGR